MEGVFRYPGEFEVQDAVWVEWVPLEEPIAGENAQAVCVKVIQALEGHARLFINCSGEGLLNVCRRQLADAGVDVDAITFTQFENSNFDVRDTGPDILVDDMGGSLCVNQNYDVYSTSTADSPDALSARKAGVKMAIEMGCYNIVSSDTISEGGNKEFDGDGTPWPDGDVHFACAASYCNFLICNGVVVGQRYWREGMSERMREKDQRAEAVLKACFPDRKVVMINTTALNLCGGGVHCWTKNIACA